MKCVGQRNGPAKQVKGGLAGGKCNLDEEGSSGTEVFDPPRSHMIGGQVGNIKLGPTAWQIARSATAFACFQLAGLIGINALHLGKPTKKP